MNTIWVLGIELTVRPSILQVHHQRENMMVSNVACVVTSYLLMVSTIRSNPEFFVYL
jgi:hypothetical protein